jgi:hypothetical protein
VDQLAAPERALADSLLAAGLDNEALFTLAGPLKPMSGITTLRLSTARTAAVREGDRAATDPAAPDLARMARYQETANALRCGPVRFLVVPFRAVQEGVRVVQISVVDEELLARILRRDLTFWGQWGFVPGSDAAVVATMIEGEGPYDRFRGYGYLFGYPEHAVHFFVEAARKGDERGELVERDFFQIPVHTADKGHFVYAVPKGYAPADVDEQLRADAARLLADYRERRPRYTNPDGTLRAVELLRDWYAERPDRIKGR